MKEWKKLNPLGKGGSKTRTRTIAISHTYIVGLGLPTEVNIPLMGKFVVDTNEKCLKLYIKVADSGTPTTGTLTSYV